MRLLIPILEYAEVDAMLALLRRLRGQPGFESLRATFYFVNDYYRELNRDARRCEDESWDWIDHRGVRTAGANGERSADRHETRPRGRQLKNKVLSILAHRAPSFFDLAMLRIQVRYLRRQAAIARDIFRREKFDLVLGGQDSAGSDNSIVFKCAHGLGIGSIIVPFAVFNDVTAKEVFKDVPAMQVSHSLMNRMVAFCYPRWKADYLGKKILRLPAYKILACEWAGLSPKRVWTYHMGFADRVAVESHRNFRQLVSEGHQESRLVLVGSAIQDELFELRSRLRPRGRKVLGCSWPTNQFQALRSSSSYADYEELCRDWAETLVGFCHRQGWELKISLHPKMKSEEVALLANLGLEAYFCPSREAVASADLFVASVSSTIAWAVFLGVPVVNYDVFGYRYRDFEEAKGVLHAYDRAHFRSLLSSLEDESILREVSSIQAQSKPDWGFADGSGVRRIAELILNEMRKRRR